MNEAAAGLLDDDCPPPHPRPLFERYAEQWMHAVALSPGPLPTVAVGQTWAHPWRPPLEVLAVDRASVWTDQGRTTVFRLLRDRRQVDGRDEAQTSSEGEL